MTCETPTDIWLIEFKLDRPAEEALAQIDERNYAEKFDFADGRTAERFSSSADAALLKSWRLTALRKD